MMRQFMAKSCPNSGKDTSEKASNCPSTENVGEKVKELKDSIEIYNLTKEAYIFTVYIVAFTAALFVWDFLNVPSWEWRLFGSLAIGVLSVFISRFLLNKYPL